VTDRQTREPASPIATATVAGALDRGLLLLKTGVLDNVVRILVPITASEEELAAGLERLDDALGHAA
jgi:4-aminobutyrate aminotransferase / (S)-3-amino-2-methylpropionate transaminase / 5-aminovalerate transaminase